MSERKGEEKEKAGPSMKREPEEEEEVAGTSQRLILPLYAGQYEAPTQALSGQEPSTSRVIGAIQPQYTTVPHPPLRVKRPGRPRIHPPKPVGISKPRGRPRGSKNKKPRKRRDTSTKLVERPPKRPRGRPRKWPPEMWEGFQRSQYAAATQQMQQLQRQQPPSQEMQGPSHLYYEEHMSHQMPQQEESSIPPPLSHLPFHIVSQQESQELTHLMPMPSQPPQQIPQQSHLHQQQLHLHHPLHPPPPQHPMQRQDEQMLLIRPLYLQEQEQQQQREQAEMLLSQEEQQRRYYEEQMHPPHPPHTTS